MTEFKLKWSEKCIREYVMDQVFGSKVMFITIAALYAISFIAVPIIGIVAYIMIKLPAPLIISLTCFAVGMILITVFLVTINVSAKKTHKALAANTDLICAVSDKDVLLIKNNLPYGVISWNDVTEITETKSAFFLLTKDNVLLVLEKDAVHSGVISETEEVLKIKSEALERNAK